MTTIAVLQSIPRFALLLAGLLIGGMSGFWFRSFWDWSHEHFSEKARWSRYIQRMRKEMEGR